jgi:polyisoprenoid-binding protein YceI
VAGPSWTLDASDGELLVHTAVTGRAAKLGHRLTIAMRHWRATVSWANGQPTAVDLTVEVDSLEVQRGDGGLKPLSGPEKTVARSNALKSLDANRFPEIKFHADNVEKSGDGYRLTGRLDIHGKGRNRVVEVAVEDVGDHWRLSGNAVVRQSEFGVKPYSLMMGSMKVVDEVTVSLALSRANIA